LHTGGFFGEFFEEFFEWGFFEFLYSRAVGGGRLQLQGRGSCRYRNTLPKFVLFEQDQERHVRRLVGSQGHR
jgi:hypothetical protein